MVTVDTIIGKVFRVYDTIEYLIQESPLPDHVYIFKDRDVSNINNRAHLSRKSVVDNINNGLWKLVDDNEMYKTNKGIEYNVGTVCGYGNYDNSTRTYTITGVTDTRVEFEFNDSKSKLSSDRAIFESALDSNDRIVISKRVNKQVNMDKTELKVGDVCTHAYGGTSTYTIKAIDSTNVLVVDSNGIELQASYSNLTKVASAKEVVAYETVVDLPGIPKGTRNVREIKGKTTTLYSFENGETRNSFDSKQVADTNFFKPIYKNVEKPIRFSKYVATLSKDHGLVFTDGEKLAFDDLRVLLVKLARTNLAAERVGDFVVETSIQITRVKVGCKSFTPEDIKVVQEAIKSLD